MPQKIYQTLDEAARSIQYQISIKPQIGIILGSGLGKIADFIESPQVLSYDQIPHFKPTSVEGHAGKMIFGKLAGAPVVALQGRFHLYEGYSMEQVALPTRTLAALGIHTLIVTNAAGGINTSFKPGDLMFIEDHINLMGDNPLKGPNLSSLGPRFPDLSEAYSLECSGILKQVAEELSIPYKKGVYVGLLGPTYETPAEVRMLRTLGGDAVGMSTVPETIAANHLGVRVVGLSCITNLAAGLSSQKLTHQEVISNSNLLADKISQILIHSIPKLMLSGHSQETS